MAWKYAMKSTFKDTHIKNGKLPGLIVGGEQLIQISQREVSILHNFGLVIDSNSLSIYKAVKINSNLKYTSQQSRTIATIDYFVKSKDGEFGAIKYFFPFRKTIYFLFEIFKVVKVSFHLKEVERADQFRVLHLTDIEKKALFMQIGSKNFVSLIPNEYEKT